MANLNIAKFNYIVLTSAAFFKVVNAIFAYLNFGHVTKIIDLVIYFIGFICTLISFRLFIIKEKKKLNKQKKQIQIP